jgi:hypothetical protein
MNTMLPDGFDASSVRELVVMAYREHHRVWELNYQHNSYNDHCCMCLVLKPWLKWLEQADKMPEGLDKHAQDAWRRERAQEAPSRVHPSLIEFLDERGTLSSAELADICYGKTEDRS